MEGKISNNYDEINQKIEDIMQNLPKLKDELNNNKDNVKKLYEIADKLEILQAELMHRNFLPCPDNLIAGLELNLKRLYFLL